MHVGGPETQSLYSTTVTENITERCFSTKKYYAHVICVVIIFNEKYSLNFTHFDFETKMKLQK